MVDFLDLELSVTDKVESLPWKPYLAVMYIMLGVFREISGNFVPNDFANIIDRLRAHAASLALNGEADSREISEISETLDRYFDEEFDDRNIPPFINSQLMVASALASDISEFISESTSNHRAASEYFSAVVREYPFFMANSVPGWLDEASANQLETNVSMKVVDESNPEVILMRAIERSAEFARTLNPPDVAAIRRAGFGEGSNDILNGLGVR